MLVKTSGFSTKKMLIILIKNLQCANVRHFVRTNVQPQHQKQVSIVRLVSCVGNMLDIFLDIFLISLVRRMLDIIVDIF